MKTLLFLLDRYPAFGGIETVTTILANQLAAHYRILICSMRGEEDHPLLHQLCGNITFRPLLRTNKTEISAELCSIIRNEHVDCVIYQDSYAPMEDLLADIKRKTPVKIIVAEHNAPGLTRVAMHNQLRQLPLWDLYALAKVLFYHSIGILKSIRRRTRLYDLCDRYIVLSERFFPEFRENSRVRETHKLRAISNPLTFVRPNIDWHKKEKRILFVGQFFNSKGIDRLLRIWQQVEQRMPGWRLTLVGDGPCMPEVRQFIKQHALCRVELVGFSSQVQAYCLSAQVLCMCSTYEGFGMVLTEGMSCGCVPMAFTSFASLADIICDGKDGFCIPAFDEDIYAARLLQLLQDDTLRSRMAHAAQEKSAKFDRQAITARWLELLGET